VASIKGWNQRHKNLPAVATSKHSDRKSTQPRPVDHKSQQLRYTAANYRQEKSTNPDCLAVPAVLSRRLVQWSPETHLGLARLAARQVLAGRDFLGVQDLRDLLRGLAHPSRQVIQWSLWNVNQTNAELYHKQQPTPSHFLPITFKQSITL